MNPSVDSKRLIWPQQKVDEVYQKRLNKEVTNKLKKETEKMIIKRKKKKESERVR